VKNDFLSKNFRFWPILSCFLTGQILIIWYWKTAKFNIEPDIPKIDIFKCLMSLILLKKPMIWYKTYTTGCVFKSSNILQNISVYRLNTFQSLEFRFRCLKWKSWVSIIQKSHGFKLLGIVKLFSNQYSTVWFKPVQTNVNKNIIRTWGLKILIKDWNKSILGMSGSMLNLAVFQYQIISIWPFRQKPIIILFTI